MTDSNDPQKDLSPTQPKVNGEGHSRSLRLAYGDLPSEGARYGDQQFRPEPYQGGHDKEEGYYEALSASIVPPSEQEGAIAPPAETFDADRSDQELVGAVTEVLALNVGIDATRIEVVCKDGIVTLSGKALDRATKRAADDAAYGVLGVRDVMNLIAST